MFLVDRCISNIQDYLLSGKSITRWANAHPINLLFIPLAFDGREQTIKDIIHPIRRFKSSDWLREGHMTWTVFDNGQF